MDNDFATGYALGADSGGSNCNNGWGGNGFGDWLVVLLLFVLMGGGFWGGNGWGGSNGSGLQGMATRADINEGFALDNITSGIRSIQQGICDSTYALNNGITGGFSSTQMSMMQGFNAANTATMQGFNGLQQQLAGCCCENREAIAQVRYDMASQACDTRNLIQSTTRDLIDNQNANFRALMDYQVQAEMRAKDAQIAELQRAASQDRQNAYITAAMSQQTQTLIDRISPYPVPSYAVPAPYPYNGQCGGCCA